MFKKVLIVLSMACLLAAPAFASEAAKSLIQVTGTSQKEVTPDIARIAFSINSVHANLDTAKDENTQIANQVLANLNGQGISSDQVKTNTYLVEPMYTYEKDRLPKLEGYRVTNSLEFSTSIEKVGVLVNEITSAGANEINSIRFETTNEADRKNEALTSAVEDALKKATVIAAALNKKVTNVTLVNESGVYYHPVMMETRQLKTANRDVPNIPAGKVTIGATVQMTVAVE